MAANTAIPIALGSIDQDLSHPSSRAAPGCLCSSAGMKTVDSFCIGSYFGRATTELLCLCRSLGKLKPRKAIASGRQQRDGAVRPKAP